MSHPLDGARLKIARAQEHLDCLKAAIQEYEVANPYAITIDNDPKQVGGKADVTKHPAPRLGAIIGDCLHNLSIPLDYVMSAVSATFSSNVLIHPPHAHHKP